MLGSERGKSEGHRVLGRGHRRPACDDPTPLHKRARCPSSRLACRPSFIQSQQECRYMKKIKYFLLGIPSKSHLVAICIFAIQTMNCHAQLAWKDRQISIDAKSADKQVGAIFTGKNIGTKEIIIRDIKTSCGCTSAEPSSRKIPPGEMVEIKTIFNIGSRTGVQQKQIVLITNDQTESNVVLTLRCNIPEIAKLSPPFLKWKAGEAMEEQEIIVKIQEPEIEVLGVASTHEAFSPRLSRLSQDSYSIKVTPSPAYNTRKANAKLRIRLNSKSRPIVHAYLNIE